MTQPAKVQEPSMEGFLRRFGASSPMTRPRPRPPESPRPADRPAAAAAAAKPEKPAAAAPAARPPVMSDIPPSAIPAAEAAAKPAPPPAKPAPPPAAPAPAVSNSQDDIDALLNGLDEATTPEEIRPPLPDGEVFELTDELAIEMEPPAPPPQQPAFHKI